MTEGKSGSYWPGEDERTVIEEMILDPHSKHWEECGNFVTQRVFKKAKNIPNAFREEIIQEVMYKVIKYLPGFEFRCTLKVWLNLLIENCIIDMYRKLRNHRQFVPLDHLLDENANEGEISTVGGARSTEDISMINDELRNAVIFLQEYASTHSNPIRNRLIIQMVIFEGYTHIATAHAAGCNAPVVSYVVREAQRYVRERMGYTQ